MTAAEKMHWWTGLDEFSEYPAAMMEVGILHSFMSTFIDLTETEPETEESGFILVRSKAGAGIRCCSVSGLGVKLILKPPRAGVQFVNVTCM